MKYTAGEARREQEVVTLKNQLNTKEGSKEANEGQKAKIQKTKDGNSESFYSNYYF